MERLTWGKIKERYSKQYIGLVDIVRCPKDNSIIEAAVVCSTPNTSYKEMLDMAINDKIFMLYPSADDTAQVGVNC